MLFQVHEGLCSNRGQARAMHPGLRTEQGSAQGYVGVERWVYARRHGSVLCLPEALH